MVNIRTILKDHHSSKTFDKSSEESLCQNEYEVSEIPNIFFDHILVDYKLTRIELSVLLYLYRQVWCRPNLYKKHGISNILSHTEMANILKLELDEIYHALRKLEEYDFINTIRSGQYFVRKFFSEEYDKHYCQTYD